MLFPTVDFAVFLVVVLAVSWLLRPRARAWRLFLLVASAVFYLDPFNPVHSDGERFLTLNPVILGALVVMVLAAARLLVAAHPVGPGRGDGAVIDLRDGAGGGAVAEPRRPADSAVAVAVRPAPPPVGPLWLAPALVTALVAVVNVVVTRACPDRPDQNARWLLLLVGVALVNQAFARAVHVARGPAARWLVVAAVAVDLAVLGWFKYANWFAEMWVDLAARAGITADWRPGVVLPVAISFFVFQAISYVVDVGRRGQRPVSLVDFTLFLTFFAHVVAGPIVRVSEFVPQLERRPDPRYVATAEAFELIFRGLFKKVVVSSYLAAQIVQPVFDAPAGFSRGEVLAAILGYAVQIYADFSGYTDIAIGVALLLGIRLPQNFDAPYRARSLQDFWRRWHVTLSRWLRDYVYVPLGGSRRGPSRTQVNVLATMLLGGLWHGANGTFVVWGALHGGGQVVERRLRRWWAARDRGPVLPAPVGAVLGWAATFSVVCVAWVFFNARDVGSALAVLGQLVAGEAAPGAVSRVTPVLVLVIGAGIASQFVPPAWPRRVFEALTAAPPLVQAAAGAAGLTVIVALGPEGIAPFIYFQF